MLKSAMNALTRTQWTASFCHHARALKFGFQAMVYFMQFAADVCIQVKQSQQLQTASVVTKP